MKIFNLAIPKKLLLSPKAWFKRRRRNRVAPMEILSEHTRTSNETKQVVSSTHQSKEQVDPSSASTSQQSNVPKKFTLSDFKLVKLLGRGSYGKVFLAKEKETKKYYAMKAVKKDKVLKCNTADMVMTERNVLALGTTSPFIAGLHSTFTSPSHLFFVMEYLSGGDLRFHLDLAQKFEVATARFYAAEVLVALQFLHKKGIIYRDLKLDNILLSSDGHVKLTDFGLSRENIGPGKRLAETFCGTLNYVAPEMIAYQKYDYSVDWWAFGVVCYKMIIGESPFSGATQQEHLHSTVHSIIKYPKTLDPRALSFVSELLVRNPHQRLGCMEQIKPIRNSSFFDGVNWNDVEERKVQPPLKPQVVQPEDISNFNTYFTQMRPKLTITKRRVVKSINQQVFSQFSFTSPKYDGVSSSSP